MAYPYVYGRRAVAELLETSLIVVKIMILESGQGRSLDQLLHSARAKSIPIIIKKRAELERITSGGVHQGVVAFYEAPKSLTVPELLDQLNDNAEELLILLDGVEDPHNFGAIIRSAEVLGVGGVIFRKHRAAGLTPTVIKASAGAALRLPLAITPNLDYAIRLLKDSNYWIYGLDQDGDVSLWETDLTGKIGYIMGGEGAGLASLTRKRCDRLIRIPQKGKIGSLNVSVSAALAMAEWLKQSDKVLK
ncbi:MAG: 23S rRNA (guanosine(2251)-2'-O)-methyltransferase RlmB [Candidatus Electryoneaceae bacterium]|nr:23S rRNA (guanosine(2251)-2'-O)-methyltransferase RlmB [Candidatus Electryoneaceae bacterium]